MVLMVSAEGHRLLGGVAEPQPEPPAPVEPPADEEVPDEPDIEGEPE